MNGAPLPYSLQKSDPLLELMSKQYVITNAGTFTYSFTLRETNLDGTVGTFSRMDTGTDVLANNEVSFHYASDGSTNLATVSRNTMTIIAGSATQVFVKR